MGKKTLVQGYPQEVPLSLRLVSLFYSQKVSLKLKIKNTCLISLPHRQPVLHWTTIAWIFNSWNILMHIITNLIMFKTYIKTVFSWQQGFRNIFFLFFAAFFPFLSSKWQGKSGKSITKCEKFKKQSTCLLAKIHNK